MEFNRPSRRVDVQKVLDLGVPCGPLIGQLKAGKDVVLENGKKITVNLISNFKFFFVNFEKYGRVLWFFFKYNIINIVRFF